MRIYSMFDQPKVEVEQNSTTRHPDFDDSLVTSIYDFLDMYCQGREIPVTKRMPQYEDNADAVFDSDVTPPGMDYDLLDALDDSMRENDDLTTNTRE